MMPKFETINEREKKQKRLNKIFALFVIGILFFSVIAYSILSINSSGNQLKYGRFGFERTIDGDGWKTKVNDLFIITKFHPSEVEEISFKGEVEGDFSNIIYFVSKTGEEREAAEEMRRNIISLKKDFACLPEDASSGECVNMTVKSCEDADYLQKVIVIRGASNETSVDYSDNCMTIRGEDYFGLLMASDKALFKILGVIK